MATNQTSTIGPNTFPTPEAPLNWKAKRATRSPSVIGMTAPEKLGRRPRGPRRPENADRRGDHAVADQEPCAGDQRPKEHAGATIRPVMQQPVERKDAPLAVVLRAQNEKGILDRDDKSQRPYGERGGAQRVFGRARGDAKDLIHRVERRSADRAKDNAERAERQRGDSAARRVIMRVPCGMRAVGSVDEKRHGLGRIFAILQWEWAIGNATQAPRPPVELSACPAEGDGNEGEFACRAGGFDDCHGSAGPCGELSGRSEKASFAIWNAGTGR